MSNTVVATSDGVRLAVQRHGDAAAPTVVAVHGYPDDHRVWDGVVAELVVDHHVVTYDVRGAGASDAPATRAGYDLAQLESDLAAVLDAVSPGLPVHLLAHDWGSIAAWHAVTGERLRGRVASYTSISGPCLDHVAHWYCRRPMRATLRERVSQSAASWYTVLFLLPVLPELVWRSGLGGGIVASRERIPRPVVRDAVNGLELYRRNMRARLARPQQRSTGVPVQVLVPTGDRYVTPSLAASARGSASDLRIRHVAGGHWMPRSRPDVVARCVRELVAHVEGAPEAPAPPRARAGGGSPSRSDERQTPVREDRTRAPGRWDGRLVVVTGAGSGIGRATALAFARRGAEVVAVDRDLPSAQRTVADGAVAAYRCDVSDGAAMEELATQVAAEHGVPAVVVNNAGIGMAGPFADTTVEDWQRIIDVNLWGVVHGCRLFGAQLRAHGQGGHIVNVASAAAYLPHRTLAAYATTKSAVLTLSACLRAELAEHGIGVTALCPGLVHTNITATTRFVGLDVATQAWHQQHTTALYARRNYTPDRVAEHLVRAVERNRAVAPVTPEAHLGLLMSRLTPGVLRALARHELPAG